MANKGENKQNCPNCSFSQFTTFATRNVVQLSNDAFSIHDKGLINLRYTECFIVLFYTENDESRKLAQIWSFVSQQVPGPTYAACNVNLERRVAEAFAKVAAHPSHPFKRYALLQWPVIIVYRDGNPVAVYNGPRETQAIADWAITLACNANYFEPAQVFGGIEAYNRYELPSPLPYVDEPGKKPVRKHNSLQYTAANPVRGMNPNIPLTKVGSKQNKEATKMVREGEAEREGLTLTPEQAEQNMGIDTTTETPSEIKFNMGEEPTQPNTPEKQPRRTRRNKRPAENETPPAQQPSSESEQSSGEEQSSNEGTTSGEESNEEQPLNEGTTSGEESNEEQSPGEE
jgi:hypothetical protein